MAELENDNYINAGDRYIAGYKIGHGQGKNMRDEFAGIALGGILSGLYSGTDDWHGWTPCDFAKEAYKIAGAMLAERDK